MAASTDSGLEFTAIIPVFNGALFVANAIRSVQRQSVGVAAIVVVDDCSTDNTQQVVAALAAADPRISFLRNETNRGPAHSRNRGLQHASTPIAAFLDADDEWLPDHARIMQQTFCAFPQAVVAYSVLAELDAAGPPRPDRAGSAFALADPLVRLLDENPIPQSATAVRAPLVLAHGGYTDDWRYGEDYELWVRLALHNAQFVEVPTVTMVRNCHDDQISLKHAKRMYEAAWTTRRSAVVSKFGREDTPGTEALASLLRSQHRDVSAALNSRRRDILESLLKVSSWIPQSESLQIRTRRLLGWRWAFWRAAAMLYDAMPASARQWWRKRRTAVF